MTDIIYADEYIYSSCNVLSNGMKNQIRYLPVGLEVESFLCDVYVELFHPVVITNVGDIPMYSLSHTTTYIRPYCFKYTASSAIRKLSTVERMDRH